MTRFARGAECGWRGAIGSVGSGAARVGDVRAPVRSEARAIFPTPTPHSWKKWRRAMWGVADGARLYAFEVISGSRNQRCVSQKAMSRDVPSDPPLPPLA